MRFRAFHSVVGLAAVLFLGLPFAHPLDAQSAVSGTCKDGTTTSAKTKSGACRGHGGVATWNATTTAAASSPVATSATGKSSKHTKKTRAASSPTATNASAATTSMTPAASSTIICSDGTTSTSKTRSGACRGHGGIQKTGTSAIATSAKPVTNTHAATPASAPVAEPATSASTASAPPATPAPKPTPAAARAPTGAEPAGATAVCKDGTYSTSKHHSGSCAHHGGVSQWLDSTSNH